MKVWMMIVVVVAAIGASAEEKLPSVLDGFKKIQKVLVEKDAAAMRTAFDARTVAMVESGRFFKKVEKALAKPDDELSAWLKDGDLELDAAAARALEPRELSWRLFTLKTFAHLEAWGPASIRLDEVSSTTAKVIVKAPDPNGGGAASTVSLAFEDGAWRLTTASIRPLTGIRSVRDSLKQMGVYLALFESKFRAYPTCWEETVRPDMLSDTELLLSSDMESDERLVYVYPIPGDMTLPDAVIAYDPAGAREGFCDVLFFQGRVDTMTTEKLEANLAAQIDGWKDEMEEAEKKAKKAAEDEGASAKRGKAEVKAIQALRDLRESLRKK